MWLSAPTTYSPLPTHPSPLTPATQVAFGMIDTRMTSRFAEDATVNIDGVEVWGQG